MSTTTTTPVTVKKTDVAAMRRLLDGIVGRSRATLLADVEAARELAVIAAKYEVTGRELADILDRTQTDVSVTLRAAKLSDDQVSEYLDAGKRVVSLSGLVTFCATGGSTPPAPQTPVQRATSAVAKLETAEELDAVIKAAQARKRALAKAALKAA